MSYRVYDLVPTPMGAAEWGWDQYQNLAVATALQTTGNFLIVRVGRDGAFARAQPYADAATMFRAWDAETTLAGDVAFAIAYDKTRAPELRVVEQRVNPVIETLRYRKIDWARLTPWIVAGAGVVAVALVITRKGGKGKARRVRRRRAPSWRRRTVTVWR